MSWPEVPLGEVVGAASTIDPARMFKEGLFEYVDLGAVDRETKRVATPTQLKGVDAPSRARQLLASRDVLVSTVRPNLNAVARIDPALDGAVGSTGFSVLRPTAKVDGNYLFHWVRGRTFIDRMVKRATGASYPAVSDRIVRESRMPLPPLEEQQRLAQMLDLADALQGKRRVALDQTSALIASVFRLTFGDPAQQNGRWPVVSLGSLATVVRGASPRPAGDPRYFGGPIPWLKISDLTTTPTSVVTNIREGVTPAGADKSVLVKAGTLILTNSATVGLPKFLGIDACIHDGFLAFVDLDRARIDQVFLYATLLLRRTQIVRLAPEGTQKNLNTSIIRGLGVAVPPLALQQAFAAQFAHIERVQTSGRISLIKLNALYATMQHSAFSGGREP